jgi:hypothetical protein
LIYFTYLSISYKVVLACSNDMFVCSLSVHHLEACVLDEHNLSIQLIGDLNMFSMFVHKLEARVLHKHDPLILWYRRRNPVSICVHNLN